MTPHDTAAADLNHGAALTTTSRAVRNDKPADDEREEGGAEEPKYRPVPARKTVTLSVRYRVRGRGRPLPYPWDEEDGK